MQQKSGSVQERNVREGRRRLLRGARLEASRRRVAAVGARRRRGDLRALLRLEPRSRLRRLGRHAGRHHSHRHHVPRPHLLARRDEPGHAAHGRRLLVRSHRLRPVGRISHRAGRERRVRNDGRRHRVLHRHVRRRHRRRAGGNAAAVLGGGIRAVRRAELSRRRAVVEVLADHHRIGAAVPRGLLRQRHPAYRFLTLGAQHRAGWHRAARRQWPAIPLRALRRAGGAAVRRVAVPRHRAAAAGGRRIRRSQTRHAEGHHARHVHADGVGVLRAVSQSVRHRRRVVQARHFRASRCSTVSAPSMARASPAHWRSSP